MTYQIATYGPGENPIRVSMLRALAARGANIHLNGDGRSLTIAQVVPDRTVCELPEFLKR